MILAIYGICSLVGGLILGKNIQKRKFLWGLVAGAIYIGLIMGISFIIRDETGGGAIGLGTGVAVALGLELLVECLGKFNEGNRPQNIVKKRLNLYHIVL